MQHRSGTTTGHWPALLPGDGVARLRAALLTAGYTADGVARRLGPDALAAMRRNDLRAALTVTRRAEQADRDRLDTLIRLFLCGQTEPAEAVTVALGGLDPVEAADAGLIIRDASGVRAGVDLEPYGDHWWIIADLPALTRGGPLPPEHVLGVGGASTMLAGATIRRPVGTALDLGTGCGVQALHLSTHAAAVTATDLSDRALRFAATTAALNGLDWELLAGDLATPVRGRRFDLVVSNPPFVAGPGGPPRYTYRDSGRAGDGICAELAAAAPDLLTDGGTIQFLANWLHVRGEDWAERVAGWFAGTGLDVWAIQREVSDPLGYVNLWRSDADERPDPAATAAWLDYFDAQNVEAVGFGLVTARAAGHTDPVVRVEEARQAVEQPLGDRVADWYARQDWLYAHRADGLLAARLRLADATLRQEATHGPDGWAVDTQVLSLNDGMRWAEEIDPLILALVSGADGTATLRDQVALLAAAHEADEDALADVAVPIVTHLVERGFLVPADGTAG